MGITLFLLFTALEIVLTVLTFTKFSEKSKWYKNRAIISIIELVALILVLVLPTGQKWRFYGCAAVIAIKSVFSGIAYLIRHKKATGKKSKIGSVIGAIVSVIIIFLSLTPAYIFTGYKGLKTTGEYKIKTTQAILIDKNRKEERETDGSNREVPVHFYYPDGNAENCPFVLFAHGSFGYYQSNSSLYEELASNGYVVASIDHPYYAFFTEDTNGNIITVDTSFMQAAIDITNGVISEEDSVAYVKEWLSIRTADENFVLDTIKSVKAENTLGDEWFTDSESEILEVISMADMNKIGLTGHSIGGASAMQLGRERDDITAVIDIDGTMFGEKVDYNSDEWVYNAEPYPIPFLALNNGSSYDGGYSPDYRDSKGRQYIDVYTLNNAIDGREMHFENTEHMDFTDLPLFSPVLASAFGRGTVDPNEFIPELNGIILNYFNYYLKGEGELNIPEWQPVN